MRDKKKLYNPCECITLTFNMERSCRYCLCEDIPFKLKVVQRQLNATNWGKVAFCDTRKSKVQCPDISIWLVSVAPLASRAGKRKMKVARKNYNLTPAIRCSRGV